MVWSEEVVEIDENWLKMELLTNEEEDGSVGSGSSKVDPPGCRYHVRITIIKKSKDARGVGKFIAAAYTSRWKLTKYLWTFELSETGQPHIHGAITMPQAYETGTMSKYMAKFDHLTEGTPGYRHEEEKDELKNSVYILKDGDIIYSNYSEHELKAIQDKVEQVKADMKMPAKDKIFNKIKIWYNKNYINKGLDGYNTYDWADFKDLKNEICNIYINEWDKLPPVNLKQVAIYCAIKGGFCFNVKEYL